MSERMIRRVDTITAYARWLALIGVPIVAFLVPSTDLGLMDSTGLGSPVLFLFVALGMAVIDAIPVIMLTFRFFPRPAALAFLILDNLFVLAMLYLGGPSMFFYAFIPVVAIGVRFDWTFALGNGAALALAHVFIALLHAGFRDIGDVLIATLGPACVLVTVAVLTSLLADGIKREPPLDDEEQKALKTRLNSLQAAADRARAIYEMAGALSATLNHDKILNAAIEIGSLGFEELTQTSSGFREHPTGVVFLYGQDGLYVAASNNLDYEESELTVSAERGVIRRVLQEGKPLLLGSLANDPELGRFKAFQRSRSAICVLLRAGFDTYGVLLFASLNPNAFTLEHVELLTAIANQAAVALANAQLYEELQNEKERAIAVHEDERNKLSRDLHDGPTQSISAIAMRLNFARLLLDRDPSKVKDELFKLENLARRTTKEIRTMLFTLRPVVLETQGLKVAIEQLVEKLKETTETGELPVVLEIGDVEDKIDINIKAVAWFITEEALNNARKYAKAQHIWIRMYIREAYFIAEVEDDGVGFDFDSTMASYDRRGSFGLLNMQERADLVNGRTTIRSQVSKGAKVTLVVPLNREVI